MSSQSNSPFRFLFWGLLLVLVVSFFGPLLLAMGRGFCYHWPAVHWPFFTTFGGPLLTLLPLVLMAAYVAVVGTLVYRDAERRGMDPWLWAAIAVFVPALIGVVIYLVVRSSMGRRCPNCGRALQPEFRVCPYCGHRQEAYCPNCQIPVAPDWRVCPRCGQELQAQPGDQRQGQPGQPVEPGRLP